MSRVYIILLAVAALFVSIAGAAFSIFGLAQLFSGAAKSVVFMAASLEFSKLVVAGFLYRYWGHINFFLRSYLVAAVGVLIGITSVGIFGYLSNAYQKSSFDLKTQMVKIKNLEEENNKIQEEIAKTEHFIENVPRSRISKKFAFYEQSRPFLTRLKNRSAKILEEIHASNLTILTTQAKVGPIVYVAETFGTDVDKVARALIFVFVSVFDPLAVSLVLCLNLAVRLNEKYRGDDYKIGALAFVKPVDHRFSRKRRSLKSRIKKAFKRVA